MDIKICLEGTSSNEERLPQYEIRLDKERLKAGTIVDEEIFEFNVDMGDADASHKLEIIFKNKTKYDTVLDDDGNIVSDMMINIKYIEFEDVELGMLIHNLSEYRPDYPGYYKEEHPELEPILKHHTYMGWNGVWSLEFKTPIFEWFLENL